MERQNDVSKQSKSYITMTTEVSTEVSTEVKSPADMSKFTGLNRKTLASGSTAWGGLSRSAHKKQTGLTGNKAAEAYAAYMSNIVTNLQTVIAEDLGSGEYCISKIVEKEAGVKIITMELKSSVLSPEQKKRLSDTLVMYKKLFKSQADLGKPRAWALQMVEYICANDNTINKALFVKTTNDIWDKQDAMNALKATIAQVEAATNNK